jgi:copper chaperone CopZ
MKLKALRAAALLLCAAGALHARAADYSVTLAGVHLCCDGCVDGASDAIAAVKGASVDADKGSKAITITATDAATAQKAVDALISAGYSGTPSDAQIHVAAPANLPGGQVQSLTLSNVHLCCKKCVTLFNQAALKVSGVKATTAAKDADSFVITGNFNAQDVITALHVAGFSAKVD